MRLVVLAIVTACATGAVAQPHSDRFRFEVSADAVRLDVAVTTAEGRYVPGLDR